MQHNYHNISQTGRRIAGMTQERWAEALRYYQSDVDAYVERCRIAAAPAAVCAPQPRPKPQPEKRKRGRPIKNAVPEYYPGMRVV